MPRIRRNAILLRLLLLPVLVLAALRLMPTLSPAPGAGRIWFGDIRESVPVTAADWEALALSVAETILHQRNADNIELPPALRGDTLPRIVFLSVSDSKSPATVALGSGPGMSAAISSAVGQALSGSRSQEQEAQEVRAEYAEVWVKVDIVQEVFPIEGIGSGKALELERSLYGLALDKESGVAFLPEELVARTLVDSNQNVEPANIEAYLRTRSANAQARGWPRDAAPARGYRFTTVGAFSDGKESTSLYRGHRRVDRASRADILLGAKQGGQYLVNSVGSDGRFVYSYLPKSDNTVEDYNILRHAGTIYAMLELYQATGDTTLLGAAQKAIEYLLGSIRSCPSGGRSASCVVEAGEVKLGGNALAVVALAKYAEVTGDRQHVPAMLDLGRWIVGTQGKDGQFRINKQSYPEGEVDDWVSTYYPGEAILALVRIYALDRDEAWLDAAESGAHYLIEVRDGKLPDAALPHDHWLLYALDDLYRYRPDPLYLEQSLRLASAIMGQQNDGGKYPDWAGGYYPDPRTTPAATRTEGLCAAYSLARDFGQEQRAKDILEAMWRGASFQLQTQFGPESVMYLDDPQRALGGFHESLTDFEIRIDYVQHNISGLLCLHRETGNGN